MKTHTCVWNGTTCTVYEMQAGEKINRHSHTVQHVTQAIQGEVKIDILADGYGEYILNPGDPALILPAEIEHEISVFGDSATIVSMIAGEHASAVAGYPRAGVMHEDGTVTPHAGS